MLFLFFFKNLERDLNEKNEKINILNKQLQESEIILQKNTTEFEQKIQSLKKDLELNTKTSGFLKTLIPNSFSK